MAHEELKPCPFCGSRSSIEAGGHIYKGGGVVAYIQCVECGTHGPFTRTQKDAIEAWNRRLSEVGDHLAQVRLAGPYNDKYCNNPHAPEVCRHYEADYKCLKFNVEDLAMACVDPTPETFYPAAVRCAACLREGGDE